jgi:hypothetical protein
MISRIAIARELATISKILSRRAGSGMSDSVFKGHVRRLMQKVARKYGGVAKGLSASGVTPEGAEWIASISRHNASNGETFGRLELTVKMDGRTKSFSEFWDWDKVFDKAGIPAVASGRISSGSITAMDFSTQDALDGYLKEHPDADRSKHKVVKQDMSTHPMNLMRQRKNEKALADMAKKLKKNTEDLTVDDIAKYNQRGRKSSSGLGTRLNNAVRMIKGGRRGIELGIREIELLAREAQQTAKEMRKIQWSTPSYEEAVLQTALMDILEEAM